MMECNKEEAHRAKEIAEKKLAMQDYNGAHKMLQKALQLYPSLENTSQMTAVLVVHMAAQTKINGCETDWYGILQVEDTQAEDMVIRKQYKKLALLLHPDKNKLPGAEAAFKLIGEALQVLSDKQQRAIHDSRRKPMVVNKSTSNRNPNRSQATNKSRNPSAASVSASLTFMTICPACHTRYQYYRVYENQNLLCHQCRTPFVAREFYVAPNNSNGFPWQQQFTQHQQQPQHQHQIHPQHQQHQQHQHQQHQHHQQYQYQQHQYQRFNGSIPATDAGVTTDYITQMMKERQYMDANLGNKRKREEEEREMRRMEKEQLKKVRADQKAQEALEKMMRKKREQEERAATKDKRKRQRKRVSGSSSEEDDEIEDSLDDVSDEEVTNHVVDSGAAPRRSARPRRNVTYRIDVSDDDDDDDDDEDSSSKANEEVKQNEEAKANEDDAQNGDSVDMQEKQKLADFFKVRIRLSLNLQNPRNSDASASGGASANASMSPNASDSANANISTSANGDGNATGNGNVDASVNATGNGNVDASVNANANGQATHEQVSNSADIVMESGKVNEHSCSVSAEKDKDPTKIESTATNDISMSPIENDSDFEENDRDSVKGKNAFKEKFKSLTKDYSASEDKGKGLVGEKTALKGKHMSLSEDYNALEEKGKVSIVGKNGVKEKSKSLSEHYAAFEVKDSGIAKLRSKRTASKKYCTFEGNNLGGAKLNSSSFSKDYPAYEGMDKDSGRETSATRLKSKSPLKNSAILEGKERTFVKLQSQSPSKEYSAFDDKDSESGKHRVQPRTKFSSQDYSVFGEKDDRRGKNSAILKSKSPSKDHYLVEEKDAGKGRNAMKSKSKSSLQNYDPFEETDPGLEKNAAKRRSKSSSKDYSWYEENVYGSGKNAVRERAKTLSKDYSLHDESFGGKGKNLTKEKLRSPLEAPCAVFETHGGKGKRNSAVEMPRSRGRSSKAEVLNLESDESEEEESEVEMIQVSKVEEYGTKKSKKKKTFHNFQQEKDVMLGQIWAAYDDIERRPRHYFRVKDIHSLAPFKATITWIELRNMNAQQKALKQHGYHPVCGANFRGSSSQTVESLDAFSHVMKWQKGPKGTLQIYPRKREVWAVYRNFKLGALTKAKAPHFTYDIVEVIDNFDEQAGVTVAHLAKSPHYDFIFKRSEAVSIVPAEELFTFSYQIPAHRLNGYEAPDIKEGFWELDPASLPR